MFLNSSPQKYNLNMIYIQLVGTRLWKWPKYLG